LSTDAPINTIRRFVSRYGNAINLCSDNGTNLVGESLFKIEYFFWSPTRGCGQRRLSTPSRLAVCSARFRPILEKIFEGVLTHHPAKTEVASTPEELRDRWHRSCRG